MRKYIFFSVCFLFDELIFEFVILICSIFLRKKKSPRCIVHLDLGSFPEWIIGIKINCISVVI